MNEILLSVSIVMVVILPLLYAATMLLCASHSMVLRLASWMALPALLLAIFSPLEFSLHLPWLLLGTELGLVDETGRLFLLFTALLWLLSGLYAQSYLADDPGRNRFFTYFLLSMSGNFGLILAQDLASYYLFFTLMSFASYGLVIHARSTEALRAGRIYILLVLIGEVLLFAAMLLATTAAGSTKFETVRHAVLQAESGDLIIFLALIGFGIKAGMLGLHVWLPLAHPVAPTPASAVLSGAMIKAGLLGWLRFLPMGEAALLQWGEIFILLGLATTFYGVAIGLMQKDPKTLLAYSSISQMGVLAIAVGVGLTAPETYPAILTVITLYAMHHGLSKGALFLGVGVMGLSSDRQRRWVWLALFLPALALAGAPLTSGMLAKALLKTQVASAPAQWVPALEVLLVCSAVATTLLVGRFLLLLSMPKLRASDKPLPAGVLWPWVMLILSAITLPWFIVSDTTVSWSASTLVGSLWPVLLGIVLTGLAIKWTSHRDRKPGMMPMGDASAGDKLSMPRIPPGDILVPITYVINLILAYGHRLAIDQLPYWQNIWKSLMRQQVSKLDWTRIYNRVELALNSWRSGLVVLLLLGLVMAFIGGTI